jgi:hypothetical protein
MVRSLFPGLTNSRAATRVRPPSVAWISTVHPGGKTAGKTQGAAVGAQTAGAVCLPRLEGADEPCSPQVETSISTAGPA